MHVVERLKCFRMELRLEATHLKTVVASSSRIIIILVAAVFVWPPVYAITPCLDFSLSREIEQELTKRAEQGDAQSAFRLAKYFSSINEYSLADFWYSKASLSEEIPILINYATYLEYIRPDRNVGKAIEVYKKAARKGVLLAQKRLGNIYHSDDYYNLDESIKWYELAALQGDTLAIVELVNCLSEKHSFREAYIWRMILGLKLDPDSEMGKDNIKGLNEVKTAITQREAKGLEYSFFKKLTLLGCTKGDELCLLKKDAVVAEYLKTYHPDEIPYSRGKSGHCSLDCEGAIEESEDCKSSSKTRSFRNKR